MAVYRIKKNKDGTVRIWARYQPFKGAATKSHIVSGGADEVGKMVFQAAEWVQKQRKTK